ncbi:ATP-binding protein [Dyella sp. 2HG41-7]|uniref:ATP-binding protein n=1 Tax=Dyella sp. 2HG41-7 TaxID=2883239 RepID=UPI001F2C4073|nr:ATP-binding protein [Dyella sp. 2HG41-7]
MAENERHPYSSRIPLSKAQFHELQIDSNGDHAISSLVERYAQILQNATETAIITMDSHGIVTGWSDGAQHVLGWSEVEMVGEPLNRIFPLESGSENHLTNEIADALQTGRGGSEGWRIHKSGRRLWAIGETKPLVNDRQEVIGLLKILRDRTAEHEIQLRLREQTKALEILNHTGSTLARENNLDAIVQAVTDAGVALSGAEFGAFFYNVIDDAGERYMLYALSGASREAFAKFPMPRNSPLFAITFNGEGIVRSDDIMLDPRYGKNAPYHGMPEGHLPVRSYLAVPVVSRSGEVLGGLFFGHSKEAMFTDRSEQNLDGLAGEAAIAIDNVRLFHAFQIEIEERRRAEGMLRELNANLEREVQERTESLRQAQKMEAVGQLTGGIAHDFNNLLQIIVGNLELLTRDLPEEPARLRRAVAYAMAGADRATTLTKRLLAFARRQPLNPKPIDVNTLVKGVSEMIHRILGETIDVETVLGAGLWKAEADTNELETALLNLAVNARDAMPSGGRLTIETFNAHLDEGYASQHAEVVAGQYIVISMTDTGLGMGPDTLSRVFEPFFTTKAEGKGTGLGLSQVYGFVKQSNGHVKIYSELGQGTTVKIYLPRLEVDLASDATQSCNVVPEAIVGETILVIEDDPAVRAYSVTALCGLGYRVFEAADGPSAIAILSNQKVDLIFTDVVLPGGMTGADIAREAATIQAGVKVLFTTGYSRNAIVHQGRLDRGVKLLTKPFRYDDLAAKVRDALDENR